VVLRLFRIFISSSVAIANSASTTEAAYAPLSTHLFGTSAQLARKVKERHGTTPFAFFFSTRARGDADLDSRVVKQSGRYFLGGKVETLAEVEARNDPKEEILRFNMRANKWYRIATNTNSWRVTQPLEADDVVLEWTPAPANSQPATATAA